MTIYYFDNIRKLLTEGFSEAELRRLSFDELSFQPVYNDLAQNASKAEIVDRILAYAKRQVKMDLLLKWAEGCNPTQYEQFKPYYSKTASPGIKRTYDFKLLWGVFGLLVLAIIGYFVWNSFQGTNILHVEELRFHAFAYQEEIDRKSTSFLTVTQNGSSDTDYILGYVLPDKDDGYAGLAFRFFEPVDLIDYEFVEVTINFWDTETKCDLGIKDITGSTDYVRLGDKLPINEDIIVSVIGNSHTIKIPLKTNFESINKKVIKEIVFNVDTRFSRGKHTFTVSQVKFLR